MGKKQGKTTFLGAAPDEGTARREACPPLSENRLAIQYATTRLLADAETLSEAAPTLLKAIAEHLDWQLGNLWLVDPFGQVMQCEESWRLSSLEDSDFVKITRVSSFTKGTGLPGLIWQTGKPAWFPDVEHDPRFPRRDAATASRLHGSFGFPIVGGGEVLGAMEFLSQQAREPDPGVMKLMASIGAQIGQFILRRRAEQSSRNLAAIVEDSEDAIVGVGRNGTFITWNKGAERLFGYTAKEAIGQPISLVVPPEGGYSAARIIERLEEGEHIPHFEGQRMCKGGVRLDVAISFSPVRDTQGHMMGYSAIYRDISERKRFEAELSAKNAALEEQALLKSRFLNAISHDLRIPLTSIIGYAEFLEDGLGGPLSARQREFVTEIEKSSQRLTYLVDNLLDTARLEAGSFTLKLETLDFAALAREVEASLRPQVERAKLMLTLSLPQAPMPMRLDSERIGRVLINLLNNAIKFTPPGGHIRLEAMPSDGGLYCEVVDTGEGIAAEDIPKLFKRFSQLPSGARRGGSGLGLSIVKDLVEAHGGTVGVKSSPGEGSRFWFTLPAAPPEH
ncbi:MAG TPA: ATP-binding protein [Pantanalinema sp.]